MCLGVTLLGPVLGGKEPIRAYYNFCIQSSIIAIRLLCSAWHFSLASLDPPIERVAKPRSLSASRPKAEEGVVHCRCLKLLCVSAAV
jgi:hypothetical protein